MSRTRAAAPPAVARPRMVFRNHDRSGEFEAQDLPLTAADLADIQAAARMIQAELRLRGAGWDSARRTTEAGRMLTAGDARRMLKEVRALEQRYYGTVVSLEDQWRTAPGLTGLLSLVADELLSWVEFWDAYTAQQPAGFADDCPEPDAACAPPGVPDYLEPLPPAENVQQLPAAPCAPPAGIPAS